MVFPDKKKAVSVILSKMKPGGGTSETEVAPETGEHNEYTSYAEDMLAAFKAGSVNDLAGVLKGYHAMIEGGDEEQDAG